MSTLCRPVHLRRDEELGPAKNVKARSVLLARTHDVHKLTDSLIFAKSLPKTQMADSKTAISNGAHMSRMEVVRNGEVTIPSTRVAERSVPGFDDLVAEPELFAKYMRSTTAR